MQSFSLLARLDGLRGLVPLFVLATFLATAFAQKTEQIRPLVLANATLIDGTGAAPRPNVTIVITDGRISEIVDATAGEHPPDANVIDLSGRYILPGLIDAHTHISSTADPPSTLRHLANAGVTSVRDMGGDARTLAVLAGDAKIGRIRAPNIYYSAVLYGPPFLQDPRSRGSAPGVEPGTAPWSRVVTPDSDVAQVVAEAKGTGATGLKLYAALEPRLVREIVSEAHRQGLKVWSHATIFPSKPSDAAAAGVNVISHSVGLYAEARSDVPSSYTEGITEWLPKQNFATVDPSGAPYDELFVLMRRHGTLLEPTLAIFRLAENRASPQSHRPPAEAANRLDIAALSNWACTATRAAHEAGVMIVAGTDSTRRLSIPIAAELEALVECGLSSLEAIRAATVNGAQAIGIEATHGSVEVGKVADLVILAADPTENIANLRQVLATVQSGRLYDLEGTIE